MPSATDKKLGIKTQIMVLMGKFVICPRRQANDISKLDKQYNNEVSLE